MDPVLLGRTVRFHPCLFEGRHRGRHTSAPQTQHHAAPPASRPHLRSPQQGSRHKSTKVGRSGGLTVKMVQIFPRESRSRGCWYLLFHNALLRGNLSVPLTASILAVVRESRNAFLSHWTRQLSLKYKRQKFTGLSWPQCIPTQNTTWK